jgi:hypothetical protein
MVRLPEDRMLDVLLDRKAIGDEHVGTLVDRLVRFHGSANTGDDVDQHGTSEAVAREVADNLQETAEQVGPGRLSRRLHGFLSRWTAEFAERHETLLDLRVRDGRIREGHGDLHCGNVCFVPQTLSSDGIAIYDCIEFSRPLRCCDVASEIGFLAMDLDRRRHAEWSDRLVDRYVDGAKDAGLVELLDFYKCHRAVVRAKVTALAASGQKGEQGRESLGEARGYL